jgi:hypothetical protein
LKKADAAQAAKKESARVGYIRAIVDACDDRTKKHGQALDGLLTFQAQACRLLDRLEARVIALEGLGGRGATRGR